MTVIREPEIFACAKALRAQYKRVAAIGFCYGGWAVFRLGAKANNGSVDCISTAHPSWVTKEEIQEVGVPVQIMAPEIDPVFTPELKELCNRVIPSLGVDFDYQFFRGLKHAFAVRGNRANEAEMKGWRGRRMRPCIGSSRGCIESRSGLCMSLISDDNEFTSIDLEELASSKKLE
ncbi:uncharacterized protein PFLUO_LOCUS4304 [Penicillium psychrofluorescens]|uniref:uncharacterized protein n=1 Tax=Penicillium psychrofluorescens TaxID=3158075 RepID=UPI003CCDCF21